MVTFEDSVCMSLSSSLELEEKMKQENAIHCNQRNRLHCAEDEEEEESECKSMQEKELRGQSESMHDKIASM